MLQAQKIIEIKRQSQKGLSIFVPTFGCLRNYGEMSLTINECRHYLFL
jgi:hypothetical protein